MTDLVRMSTHPQDPSVVVLRTPPELQSVMGKFAPARYNPDRHVYELLAEHVPAFVKFCSHYQVHPLDERTPVGGSKRRPSHECANVVEYLTITGQETDRLNPNGIPIHCGQPGSVEHPPRVCPMCGRSWNPQPVRQDDYDEAFHFECIRCHDARPLAERPTKPDQTRYCGNCGNRHPYVKRTKRPLIGADKRAKMTDPMSLGEAARELEAGLRAAETTRPVPPWLPQHFEGRPITDQPLPGVDTDDA